MRPKLHACFGSSIRGRGDGIKHDRVDCRRHVPNRVLPPGFHQRCHTPQSSDARALVSALRDLAQHLHECILVGRRSLVERPCLRFALHCIALHCNSERYNVVTSDHNWSAARQHICIRQKEVVLVLPWTLVRGGPAEWHLA